MYLKPKTILYVCGFGTRSPFRTQKPSVRRNIRYFRHCLFLTYHILEAYISDKQMCLEPNIIDFLFFFFSANCSPSAIDLRVTACLIFDRNEMEAVIDRSTVHLVDCAVV